MACSSTSSLHLFSLTPKTLSRSSRSFAASLSFLHSSSPHLPKLLRSSSSPRTSNRSFRRLVISSDEEVYGSLGEGSDADEERPASPDLKIFVGNLPFNVDSSALAGLFEQAGTVEMVEVIYDRISGRSRGFGFVTMSSVEEVEAAVEKFNGYELEGRALRVNSGPPPPKGESPFRGDGGPRGGGRSFDNTNRLYVGNLAWSVDNFALETLFSEQGKVVEAKVVYDRDTGRSRGFGFVTYSSADEVNRAIDLLNGTDLDGRQIRVSVAESLPRRQF